MPLTSLLPSLVFVCPSNWGFLIFILITAHSPSRVSSPRDGFQVLDHVVGIGIIVDGAGQRGFESDEMGSAFCGVDVVDKGKDVF